MYEQDSSKSAAKPGSITGFLDRYFHITERNSKLWTEILAGLTTFMTMAYIIVVNPKILSTPGTGLEWNLVFIGTCIAGAVATLAMGLYAKYPFALASGMGLNAVLTYNVILTQNLTWQEAMGVVVIEGLLVTLLVLTRLREMVMDAIPKSLKLAIGAAIGLFIAYIGFTDAEIVVGSGSSTLITFGNVANPVVMIAVLTIVLIMAFMAMKLRGAILYGIVLSTIITIGVCLLANQMGYAFNAYGDQGLPAIIQSMPTGGNNLPAPPATSLDIGGFINVISQVIQAIPSDLKLSLVPVIFAFMMVDFFDTMGTVVAVGERGNMLDKNGKLPGLNRVLLVDSLAAVGGGLSGASSVTTYVESSSGVAAGGRTGLVSVVVGILFLISLVFLPLAAYIPTAAAAPALIIVGYLMLTSVKDIAWDQIEDALPAFLTIVAMVFTFSISKGVGVGFISYCLIKAFSGKWKEVHPLMWIVALVFLVYFIFVSQTI